jgi:protein TonB
MMPDSVEQLMEDVLREVANPTPTGDLALRVAHRSLAMDVAATSPTNLLMFSSLDRTGGSGMSRGSVSIAILFNVAATLLLGLQVRAHVMERHMAMELSYVAPLEKLIEPIKPKILPKLPPPPPMELPAQPPKIMLPKVAVAAPPIPMPVAAPRPLPLVVPAPPKIQLAAAAPAVQSVTLPARSASVGNNDSHPTAVALGHPDSPVPFQKSGPAVASVNMNRGMSGMPPANAGGGPPAAKVNLGNGSPGGSIGGTSPAPVAGVKLGCAGCTGTAAGNGTGRQAAQVLSLGVAPPPPPAATAVARTPVARAPQVLYKPHPAYTAEATSLHIEGTVLVKIRVSAAGVVTVLGVMQGLGHGLDQSAVDVARGIRFKPAVDAAGTPIDWEGIVNITFQMS